MSDVALRTVGLGKMYRIGGEGASRIERCVIRSRRPSNARSSVFATLAPLPTPRRTLWALKDISLEVKRDEVMGVIGRNGSGKSTLLKVLSHITEPTEGRAEIRGRVASLLEVGTGFTAS